MNTDSGSNLSHNGIPLILILIFVVQLLAHFFILETTQYLNVITSSNIQHRQKDQNLSTDTSHLICPLIVQLLAHLFILQHNHNLKAIFVDLIIKHKQL